jgi:phosphatidylglycerol:prolipoprotein diacylglycerol transferase
MQSILFPNFNPIAFSLGPISIHWYALAYIVGILGGYLHLKRINKLKPIVFSQKSFDDIILFSVLGIVFGGRIGYVFFYNFKKFLTDPIFLFQTWNGGMSFHGGVIGLIIAIYFLCKKHNLNFLRSLDLITCVAPIGLFLGRLANFVNAELYGRPTDIAWGVIFPNSDGIARHPSQLYEAFCEGIILFCIMNLLLQNKNVRSSPGKLGGIFLIFYSCFRIIIEFFREPDFQIGFLLDFFTLGQLLSLPMLLIGCYFVFRKAKI